MGIVGAEADNGGHTAKHGEQVAASHCGHRSLSLCRCCGPAAGAFGGRPGALQNVSMMSCATNAAIVPNNGYIALESGDCAYVLTLDMTKPPFLGCLPATVVADLIRRWAPVPNL